MSNIKKIVFCDSTDIAEKLSNNLEGSEVVDAQVSVSSNSSNSDIREAARQEGVPDRKYSIAQVEYKKEKSNEY